MKIFSTPLQILNAVRHSAEMHINAPFKGRSTLVAMVTTAACSRPGASFSYKHYITLQIGTSTIHSDTIRLHFDSFNFP